MDGLVPDVELGSGRACDNSTSFRADIIESITLAFISESLVYNERRRLSLALRMAISYDLFDF